MFYAVPSPNCPNTMTLTWRSAVKEVFFVAGIFALAFITLANLG